MVMLVIKMFNINFKKQKILKNQKGFFIVELLVATFIFGIVMTVSIGALITALDANKKNQSLQSVLNNLNVSLETITKTIAVGAYYYCDGYSLPPSTSTNDCPISGNQPGGTSIGFLYNKDLNEDDIANDVIVYKFEPGSGKGYISRTIHYGGTGGSSEAVRMTAPEVNITAMKFYVSGSATFVNNNYEQPKVIITIDGNAPAGPRNPAGTQFRVQTMVTQRIPDFQ